MQRQTIIGSVLRELWSKYQEKRKPPSMAEELSKILAEEIKEEIDQEILTDILKMSKEIDDGRK